MNKKEYKEIPPALLEKIKGEVWSIESMAGHGAEGRPVNYVGSTREGNIIHDYYEDNQGKYWYQNRAIVNGCIVSMEVYIFGKEIPQTKRRRG